MKNKKCFKITFQSEWFKFNFNYVKTLDVRQYKILEQCHKEKLKQNIEILSFWKDQIVVNFFDYIDEVIEGQKKTKLLPSVVE